MMTNTANTMTPQARFRATLAHRQPDRPPIQFWGTSEITERLKLHFLECGAGDDLQRALDVDFRYVWPKALHRDNAATDTELPDGIYQDVTSRPLDWIQTFSDVARYRSRFDPDAYDFSGLSAACEAAQPFVRVFGSPGLFDIVNGLGARGRGLENLLCEIMVEDPVAVALIDRHLEMDYEYCRRGLEAGRGGIELIHIGEDCGNQRGPLFPPEFFARFFAPRLRRFVDLAHRHGVACMLHSCGSIRALLPILIDEVGLDIHDACQPEAAGMEPESLKRDFGDRITFCGMLSLQQTLTHGTPDHCRREARHRIQAIGRDGGYIFAPANTITNDAPIENILAAYETATGRLLQS